MISSYLIRSSLSLHLSTSVFTQTLLLLIPMTNWHFACDHGILGYRYWYPWPILIVRRSEGPAFTTLRPTNPGSSLARTLTAILFHDLTLTFLGGSRSSIAMHSGHSTNSRLSSAAVYAAFGHRVELHGTSLMPISRAWTYEMHSIA